MNPITSAIKTLAHNHIDCLGVSTRLIYNTNILKQWPQSRSNTANRSCAICVETSHNADKCFLNPLNPEKKIEPQFEERKVQLIRCQLVQGEWKWYRAGSKNQKNKETEHCAFIDHIGQNVHQTVDKMMLVSGTTSHLTSRNNKVSDSKSTNVLITLANDLKMIGTERFERYSKQRTKKMLKSNYRTRSSFQLYLRVYFQFLL